MALHCFNLCVCWFDDALSKSEISKIHSLFYFAVHTQGENSPIWKFWSQFEQIHWLMQHNAIHGVQFQLFFFNYCIRQFMILLINISFSNFFIYFNYLKRVSNFYNTEISKFFTYIPCVTFSFRFICLKPTLHN